MMALITLLTRCDDPGFVCDGETAEINFRIPGSGVKQHGANWEIQVVAKFDFYSTVNVSFTCCIFHYRNTIS